jgi:hypothetical protein
MTRRRQRGGGKKQGATGRPAYEPPRLVRVDLPNLQGQVLDDSAPLLAQGGNPSSNVQVTALFPPPPTPP